MCSKDAPSQLSEFSETGSDLVKVTPLNVLKNPLIRHIPIIKELASAYETVGNVRDWFFTCKILNFLTKIETFSEEQKQRFRESMHGDKQKIRLGERLFLIIDKLDDVPKAILLANAFRPYLDGKIDIKILQRLWIAIDRFDLDDLECLQFLKDKQGLREVEMTECESLRNAGLLYLHDEGMTIAGSNVDYRLSALGTIFLNYVDEELDKGPGEDVL